MDVIASSGWWITLIFGWFVLKVIERFIGSKLDKAFNLYAKDRYNKKALKKRKYYDEILLLTKNPHRLQLKKYQMYSYLLTVLVVGLSQHDTGELAANIYLAGDSLLFKAAGIFLMSFTSIVILIFIALTWRCYMIIITVYNCLAEEVDNPGFLLEDEMKEGE